MKRKRFPPNDPREWITHETRYPGLADPVTKSNHRRAVRIATAVVLCELRRLAASR